MYLTGLQAEQVSPPSYDLVCQVGVRWSYGDQDPDVLEFWWKGDSDSNWTWIEPHLRVEGGDPMSEAELIVPAGVPGLIIACPRLLDDRGQLTYRQPDDDGDEQIWDGFCLFTRFVGERLSGKPGLRCHLPPDITHMEVGYGSVYLRWTNPEGYDRFAVDFVDPRTGGNPRTYITENRDYRFEKIPTGGCWAKVAGIHDANDWTGTTECRSPWSRLRETSVPAELGYVEARFEPGVPVGVLKQTEDHTEVFACLPDGRPVAIWGDSPGRWHAWYGHGKGPGFPAGAPLASLSRAAGHMDVFGASSDGRIYLAWWHGNPWREWYVLSDAEFPGGAYIATLSRNTDQMDTFAVGTDGVVRSNWWNGDPWGAWFRLDGATFPAGGPIAAISRNPDQMDIFAVGTDGVVRNNWWNGNPWRGWSELGGVSFPPGAGIAATTRNPDQMDIFVVGSDGVVRSNWWNGSPWRGWFELAGATFPPGAPITAISHRADSMTVAAVGTDGQARRITWGGSWSSWQVLPGVTFPAGAGVFVVPRAGLFAVATDGYLRANTLSVTNPSWYKVA